METGDSAKIFEYHPTLGIARIIDRAFASMMNKSRGQAKSRAKTALLVTTIALAIVVGSCIWGLVDVERAMTAIKTNAQWLAGADRAQAALIAADRTVERAFDDNAPDNLAPPFEESTLALDLAIFDEIAVDAALLESWRRAKVEVLRGDRELAGARLPKSERMALGLSLLRSIREADTAIIGMRRAVRDRQRELSQSIVLVWRTLTVLAGLLVLAAAAFGVFVRAVGTRGTMLEAAEARFESIVQATPDLVWSVDVDGRWTFVNESCRRIYGYEPHEMIGRKFLEFLAPDVVERDLAAFGEIKAGRVLNCHETVHLRKDGSRVPLAFSAAPLYDAAGRLLGTAGTATDTSVVLALHERLAHAEKLRAIGATAGSVAHDFGNALTGIVGHAELALRDVAPNSSTAAHLQDIIASADRARILISEITSFTRRRPLRMEVFEIGRFAREIAGGIRSTFGTGVTLSVEIADPDIRVEADKSQIEQVLLNLILNARDAIGSKGTIRIDVEKVLLDERESRKLSLPPGLWARTDVSDDGVGMDRETLKRIFEPFFTTKPEGKGTGLGLPAVHAILERQGGAVTVESTPGSGSRFSFYLRATEAPLTRSDSNSPTSGVEVPGRRSILIVEDQPEVAKVMFAVLSRAGYDVTIAGSVAEADIRLAQGPELIICDASLGPDCGVEWLKRIDLAGRAVVVTSGFHRDDIDQLKPRARAVRFLMKPFAGSALLEEVKAVFAESIGRGHSV